MIDLFAGPGGLDLPGEELGLHPLGIEWDPNACATRVASGLRTIQGDVRSYSPADFPGMRRVLAGGPPCQTFTVVGLGAGRASLEPLCAAVRASGLAGGPEAPGGLDERTTLVLEPLRWILEAARDDDPFRTVVLEQVPAVLPVWQAYADVLAGLGYATALGVVNTEEYGVPQTRRRAVLVASLDGAVALPRPTHARHGRPAGGRRPIAAMRDTVLGRRGPFEMVSNYGTGGDSRNRGRRSWEEPSFTVTGKILRNRLFAPGGKELARLTPSEAGTLQTFPEAWRWSGADRGQQIGNACPPLLGRALLRAALRI